VIAAMMLRASASPSSAS